MYPLDQEKIAKIIESLFGIKTDFVGSMLSSIAKVNMASVVEAANEEHSEPWCELCKKHNIKNSPLTSFLAQELLYNNPLSVDGSFIETTGFRYMVPAVRFCSSCWVHFLFLSALTMGADLPFFQFSFQFIIR